MCIWRHQKAGLGIPGDNLRKKKIINSPRNPNTKFNSVNGLSPLKVLRSVPAVVPSNQAGRSTQTKVPTKSTHISKFQDALAVPFT